MSTEVSNVKGTRIAGRKREREKNEANEDEQENKKTNREIRNDVGKRRRRRRRRRGQSKVASRGARDRPRSEGLRRDGDAAVGVDAICIEKEPSLSADRQRFLFVFLLFVCFFFHRVAIRFIPTRFLSTRLQRPCVTKWIINV